MPRSWLSHKDFEAPVARSCVCVKPRRRSSERYRKPWSTRSATISGCPMTTCRIRGLLVALLLLATTRAYAGHAGEMGAPGLMPHELVASLLGLAAILLFTILSLAWG